jgi:Domain of unknown function (DUF202)
MAIPTDKPGLQPERTQLAWERTAIGFLTIGALILLRHRELVFPGRSFAAMLAFTLTIAVVLIGRGRSVGLMPSRTGILAIGCATVSLAITVGVLILTVGT